MDSQEKKTPRGRAYPSIDLPKAIELARKLDEAYRSTPIDRVSAVQCLGYSSLSGPASRMLAALTAYDLIERIGNGEIRVSERAKAILHSETREEYISNLEASAMSPPLFRQLRERFASVSIPPAESVENFLNRQEFGVRAVQIAARVFESTVKYLEAQRAVDPPELKSDNDAADLAEASEQSSAGSGSLDRPPGEEELMRNTLAGGASFRLLVRGGPLNRRQGEQLKKLVDVQLDVALEGDGTGVDPTGSETGDPGVS